MQEVKNKKIIGVYKITCTGNNKIYIGSSKDIKYRWAMHKTQLKRGTHHSPYLQRSYNKYGKESITFSIIATMSEYDEPLLRRLEWYYINKYRPEFNCAAPVVYKQTNEWKRKISESTKKLYTEKNYTNPRKGVGKKCTIYDWLGNPVYFSLTVSEVAKTLNLKSYHTINSNLRKYQGFAATDSFYIIAIEGVELNKLLDIYKNTSFNFRCPICDLEGNIYRRKERFSYIDSETHETKSILFMDIYKEIMKSEHLFYKINNKIFTLPGLCPIIQQCINETHLDIVGS